MKQSLVLQKNKHTVSITEARKLLGSEAKGLTDQEVEQLIMQLELMADIVITKIKKTMVVPNST